MNAARALVATDLGLVARLHAECFEDAWDEAALAALLAMPGAFGLLSTAQDGFILLRAVPGEAEILSLGVAPAARRRGVARSLLSAATVESFRRGAEKLYLEVACDNFAALGLYSSAGFLEVGRRGNYYVRTGSTVDALVLARDVGRSAETARRGVP
jgi:ribosomal-protein-alanine N-acetyltransferase